MSFDEVGALTVTRSPAGWVVGLIFDDVRASDPLPWEAVAAELDSFVERVGAAISALGFDREFVLGPER